MAAIVRPRFYWSIALALALLVLAGFARTFYLAFLFDSPRLTVLLHLHGLAFTAWVLLFIVQTRLISTGNVRTHMTLGSFGIALAIAVFVLGVLTALASLDSPRPRPLGMNNEQFLIFPIVAIALFGGFVAAAIANRRRAELHRRCMMLATIAVMNPPIARLIELFSAQAYFAQIQIGVTAAFVVACLVYDWRKYHIVHPVYGFGGALVVLSLPLRAAVAMTAGWQAFAHWLAT